MPEEITAPVQEEVVDRPTTSEDNAEENANAQPGEAGGENADPQANAKEAGEQKDNEEQKRRGGWQRQRDKARREAELARQEAEYWKQQVIGKQQPQAQQTAKPEAKAKPKPEDFRIEGTDTYDVAAFTEALTEYKAEQKIAEAESRRQEAEARKQAETQEEAVTRQYKERVSKVSASLKDFDEKAQECAETLTDIAPDPRNAPPGARVIGDAILRNDPEGQLEYYLGSHPEEIERIAELDHTAAAIEIGKLFAKFATEKTETEQEEEDEKPVPVVTKAPPPLTPTRKASPSARPFDPSDPRNDKELSFEEWNKRDMERRRKR